MFDVAFTLLVPIFMGLFLGMQMDKGKDFPLYTVVFSILGMFVGMWGVYKRYK
jgi:F0F1-type ATP synthase assembly protein I